MFRKLASKFGSRNDHDSTLPQKNFRCNTYPAFEVTDFSSQYGSENSMSYTACNLAGKSNIYPNYGDFTHACVFRTYGQFWDQLPSSRAPFYRTPSTFYSQDYIELRFETKLYPQKITVYETYNPGCLVRILACETGQDTDVDTGISHTRWKTLWEGSPEKIPTDQLGSRKFSPSLEPCPFPTSLIRLELCHHHAYYYTELDCVELTGSSENPFKDAQKTIPGANNQSQQVQEDLLKGMKDLKLGENNSQETTSSGKGKETRDMTENIIETNNDHFVLLPAECIQLILSFLDVLSLSRVARTCRLFKTHSYDSLQYTELNLQPHWTQVNDVALDSLQERSLLLQRLNLSWCHGNILTDKAFIRYIKTCGNGLKDLYLSSCNFLISQSVSDLVEYCPNLIELDIGGCRQIECQDLVNIKKLKQLRKLNLYRTMVDTLTIMAIIQSCPELRHLNLGACTRIDNFNRVMQDLSEHCHNLESLDLWRARSVSHVGLLAIAYGCPNLLELDIGWCTDVKSSTCCIIELVKSCVKLKKLFLTANRTICDADLQAIAENSRDLEQLDILGTREVSADVAQIVMERCEKLRFFDVSFCSGIELYTVNIWKEMFPHVAVKRSFQN